MKNNLFEMLMKFFETSLAQIKENYTLQKLSPLVVLPNEDELDYSNLEKHTLFIRPANQKAIRVITELEAFKFTKASHQFIVRLIQLDFIPTEILEQIMTQLLFSDSRFVTLAQTKWAIRKTFANHMNITQMAFLDMVLYQKEDALTLH